MQQGSLLRGFRSRLGGVFGKHGNPDVASIGKLGIFDAERYRRLYLDETRSSNNLIAHYVATGALEGLSPCEYFDSRYYLDRNPDVYKSGLNPLLHYCNWGWRESRNPSVEFDSDWYAATYLKHSADDIAPLVHYLTKGRVAGLEIRPVSDPDYALIEASGVFDADFYRSEYPDLAETGIDPIAHYLKYGAREGRKPSAMFDTAWYLRNNPDVVLAGQNPLLHFCRTGWKELRNPGRDFDVWWYWSEHIDPASEDVNPLGHYQLHGRQQGLETRPRGPLAQWAGSGFRHASGHAIRRVCLFAGYDPDGIVDAYVVDYLRELSRHADVYYLADGHMQPGELDKIAPFTAGAWSERHGEYDFGSWSRLAQTLVGWEAIGQYDELILVNDSCYLLRGLEDVFAKMDAKPCDWWGMQATKGIAATRENPRNRFPQPIPMTTVRASLLDTFETDAVYDFLVGSYFVVYRKPVIGDAGFRRRLDTVVRQAWKKNIVLKYEVGLTRYLIANHFSFDTFIASLYPFHPIYSNWYFRLVDEGFPLLKRYFLSENHYRVAGLAAWMERIRRKLPDAAVDTIRHNLERVTDAEKLHQSMHVGTPRVETDAPEPSELLDHESFLAADQASPKHGHWWAFPVCAFSGAFSGNERAVFEDVKNDPAIRKIVLARDRPVAVDGVEVEVAPLESPRGQYLLMRCGNIFIKHSPTRNLVYPVASELHNIINLWHGIPFKRIGHASLDMRERGPEIAREHAMCRAVISSSHIDAMAMGVSFYPLTYQDVWITGLPRNDFILREFDQLPATFQTEAAELQALLCGRRLVLYMPTFRNAQEDGYYRFGEEEVAALREWLDHHNAVLGLREHMADSARVYTRQLASLQPLDLGDEYFPNVEVLYRCSDALITDYSSCFIDYMLTGKPAVSFAYDYDSYSSIERGSFYRLEDVFPGCVCRDFAALRSALDDLFAPASAACTQALDWKRSLFFDYLDDGSAARVVAHVRQLTETTGLGRLDYSRD